MLLLKGHEPGKAVYGLAFAPDGRRLASCGNDRTVRLWGLADGREEAPLPRRELDGWVDFHPAGALLACAGLEVRVWDLSAGPKLLFQTATRAYQAVFSPDGSCLAAGGDELRRWDTKTWAPLPAWAGARKKARGHFPQSLFTGPLAFSRDGRLLATAHDAHEARHRYNPVIRLWGAATGEPRGELGHAGRLARALAIGGDDRLLAALSGPTLHVWDLPSGRRLAERQLGAKHLTALAFTPDGRYLLVAGNDKSVRVWDARSWAEHTAFDWDIGPVVTVAVAADGMRAAAGGRNGKIVVWDLDL
jgi:WD40 repeat protein